MLIIILFICMKFTYSFKQPLIDCIDPIKLRKYLHREINKNYVPLSYQRAKNILNNEINMIDIYGDNSESKNVEHIVPQSLFKNDINKKNMKSDLHHLYLCNSKLNSRRQNFKYVDPNEYVSDTTCSNQYLNLKGIPETTLDGMFKNNGYLMISNKKKKMFIPTEYSRGKISRSISYFAIKYNYTEYISSIISFETLLMWNLKDPVDNEEYLKNIICYKHQQNINPFILNPDLMNFCFTDYYTLSNKLYSKKKDPIIDPLYIIDYFINELNMNEEKIQKYSKILKKIDKIDKIDKS
jgi:endonuclease I